MALWHLYPDELAPGPTPWYPPQGTMMAVVVRAPDEETARIIATLSGRKEVDVNPDAWKDPRLSKCVELRGDGHNETIVADVNYE